MTEKEYINTLSRLQSEWYTSYTDWLDDYYTDNCSISIDEFSKEYDTIHNNLISKNDKKMVEEIVNEETVDVTAELDSTPVEVADSVESTATNADTTDAVETDEA